MARADGDPRRVPRRPGARARARARSVSASPSCSTAIRCRRAAASATRTRAARAPRSSPAIATAPAAPRALTAHVTATSRARASPSRANDPYKGGFITTHHGRPADRIHAIQIELRRDLYMDEDAYVTDRARVRQAPRHHRRPARLAARPPRSDQVARRVRGPVRAVFVFEGGERKCGRRRVCVAVHASRDAHPVPANASRNGPDSLTLAHDRGRSSGAAVQVFDDRRVLVDHDLALDAQLGRQVARGLGQVGGEDRELLDRLERRQRRVQRVDLLLQRRAAPRATLRQRLAVVRRRTACAPRRTASPARRRTAACRRRPAPG